MSAVNYHDKDRDYNDYNDNEDNENDDPYLRKITTTMKQLAVKSLSQWMRSY